MHDAFFLGEDPHLESLAEIGCGFGRELAYKLGALGAAAVPRKVDGILIGQARGVSRLCGLAWVCVTRR